jgi:hypothetical protein
MSVGRIVVFSILRTCGLLGLCFRGDEKIKCKVGNVNVWRSVEVCGGLEMN